MKTRVVVLQKLENQKLCRGSNPQTEPHTGKLSSGEETLADPFEFESRSAPAGQHLKKLSAETTRSGTL